MEDAALAGVGVALALSFLVVLLRCAARRRGNTPPRKAGWIPWLGVALEFGKAPLWYIQKTREELGDTFTILAAGKCMTFIFSHDQTHLFFQSSQADFQSAVQPFTQKAAGVPRSSFHRHHTSVHDAVKGRLTGQLSHLCPALSTQFYRQLCSWLDVRKTGEGSVVVELMDLVRATMFPAVVRQLFGSDNIQLSDEELAQVSKTFACYDADFEYGAELPSLFLPKWKRSRNELLTLMQAVVSRVQQRNVCPMKLVEHVIGIVDTSSSPGYCLLFLWASQANAIPISYWTLAYILSHPETLGEVLDQLKKWELMGPDDQFSAVSESNLHSLSAIKRAVLETIRLRAPGMITRKLTAPLSLKEFVVPAGHLLMLSPYWLHRDPALFPDPDKFKPERWSACEIEKGQFLPGFVGFGGGRYHCPGRWFALMEIQLYVAMTLKLFRMELLDTIPAPSPLHLVGSQQPSGPCHVMVRVHT